MENVITIKGEGSGSGQTSAARARASARKGGKNPFKAGSGRANKYARLRRAQASVLANPRQGKNTAARRLLSANKVGPRSNLSTVANAAKNFKEARAGTPRRTTRG